MAWTAQGTRPLRVLTGSPWPPPAALVESALTLGIPIPDTEAESKVPSTALAVSVEVCLCLRCHVIISLFVFVLLADSALMLGATVCAKTHDVAALGMVFVYDHCYFL